MVLMESKYNNLAELLSQRAQEKKAQRLYTFLLDGENEESLLNYEELQEQSTCLATVLQGSKAREKKALLLYPPGLDYIVAFFACLKAKVIAVPAYPPDPNRLSRTLPRLLSIIRDSGAEIVLTNSAIKGMAEFLFQEAPELRRLEWIASDEDLSVTSSEFKEESISSQDLAFIQYTSGSTGNPKGVMLTHENLLFNLAAIQTCFGHHDQSQGVIWLPPYHDMGLIGGILQPLYAGFPVTLMSPLDFLQKPLRWLRAISKYHATTSGGPNFAYDLCAKKATSEDIKTLDLSTWDLAFTGAEPIQVETIQRFSETFEACGFRPESFYPCYGLAEGTLIVSGGKKQSPLHFKKIDKSALKENQVVENSDSNFSIVSCGPSLSQQDLSILNPESLEPLKAGQVGEIWVRGPSIAQGYWNKNEETQKSFQARSAAGEGPFLRTGDLGFLDKGELFVTGRMKDVIIIRGANYYPQDIEWVLEQANLPLRMGCGAAFSTYQKGEEVLVLAWEVDESKFASEEYALKIFKEIQGLVAQHFDLSIHDIVLIKRASIPKTSSGKIQRHLCKAAYEESSLDSVYQFKNIKNAAQEKAKDLEHPAPMASTQHLEKNNVSHMQQWLTQELVRRFNLKESDIDLKKPFSFYGIDSKEALSLAGDIEDTLHVKLPPTLLWQYPDIDRLATFLSGAARLKA